MAFTAGLEQLPTCNQTNSFSLIKIVERDPVFQVLLWEIMLSILFMSDRGVTMWTIAGW